jgi:hypothetical protein
MMRGIHGDWLPMNDKAGRQSYLSRNPMDRKAFSLHGSMPLLRCGCANYCRVDE